MVLVVIARVALIGRLFTNVSVEIHWARDAGQPATRIMAVVLSLMPSKMSSCFKAHHNCGCDATIYAIPTTYVIAR